ncbi:MAG: hypothetical protein JSW40_03330 [Candidatus Omnitrophota bacterium]|nr:MAG: hypothetical protein JSW40_03330 [Candidatus Omnitrophota bacterium]
MQRRKISIVIAILIIGVVYLILKINSGYFRAKEPKGEKAVEASLHIIAAAEMHYHETHSTYGSLNQFAKLKPPIIGADLARGSKYGYNFSVFASRNSFYAVAVPTKELSKNHIFYIDERGEVCKSDMPGISAPTVHADKGSCPVGFSRVKEQFK